MAEGDDAVVSILSPVFNESAHIEEMIESVTAQTESALELIVVDDGSTDDTAAKVAALAARDPRIRVVAEGKLGKVAAFTRAFDESRGDVIVLLGGDDVLTPESIAVRARAVRSARSADSPRVVAFSRLVTFSDDPKFDGQVIPRDARRGARSGGTLAMSRELAALAFPVPTELPAEDLWIGGVAGSLADTSIDLPDVVLRYRIHPGNSNPRGLPFAKMTESMHARMKAYDLLATSALDLPQHDRRRFAAIAAVEEERYAGRLWGVLAHRDASWSTRLRAASMTNAFLFAVRTRLFKFFSGR